MKQVDVCDERTLEAIMRGLKAAAYGKPIAFAFDAGMTRHREGEAVVEVPNGTLTFRLYVNGGAVSHDAVEPEKVPA